MPVSETEEDMLALEDRLELEQESHELDLEIKAMKAKLQLKERIELEESHSRAGGDDSVGTALYIDAAPDSGTC